VGLEVMMERVRACSIQRAGRREFQIVEAADFQIIYGYVVIWYISYFFY